MTPHMTKPWTCVALGDGAFQIFTEDCGDGPAILCTRAPWPQHAKASAANGRLMAASPDMLTCLIHLSNEVLGSLPLMEELARREFGNTNYNLLIQRANEARDLIAKATAIT